MTERERVALAREIAGTVEKGSAGHSCRCNGNPAPAGAGQAPWGGLGSRVDMFLPASDAAEPELHRFLGAALRAGARSACVPPRWTALAVRALAERSIAVASVVGYPAGASLTPAKCAEAEWLLRLGAEELWMVADIGGIRSGDLDSAYVDIKAVAQLAACRSARLNVVLELPLLNDRQKAEACVIARLAGAASAVSASGSRGSLARPSDIELMRRTVGDDLEIVAAGGIRGVSAARQMFDAGASRVRADLDSALSEPG